MKLYLVQKNVGLEVASILRRLNGIFRFALWDADAEPMLVVLASLGVKQLYYSCAGISFAFSSEIKALQAHMSGDRELDAATQDTVTLQLTFADGSVGTVHYFANGSKEFPKERLEVFAVGRVLQLDNFRKLSGFGCPGFSKMNLWRQDKGYKVCAQAFVRAIQMGLRSPIPAAEIFEVSRVSIEMAE